MAKAPNPYLTAGKAARMCGVSNRTVINWISRGDLQANRLPSGHYRIHADVLRGFLATRRPSRPHAVKHAQPAARDLCWYRADAGPEHRCTECLVYRAHAVHCFVLRAELQPAQLGCQILCEECSHFHRVYEQISEGLEFDSTPCAVSRGGAVLGANTAFRALLTLDGRPLIGRTWMEFIAPDEREGLARWAAQVRASAADVVLRIDTRLVRGDGTTLPVTLETTWFPRIPGSVVTRFHSR